MKRIYLLLLLSIAPFVLLSGQRRSTLIRGDSMLCENVYVIHENGEILKYGIQVENWAHHSDSLYMLMDKEECRQMKEALQKLNSKYRRWSRLARIHKVHDYSKPFDIELPPVVFQWTPTGRYGIPSSFRLVAEPVVMRPRFSVPDRWHCYVVIDSVYLHEKPIKDMAYPVELVFSSPGILQIVIKNLDTRRIDRLYREKYPSAKDKERYDSIFK